VLTFRLRKERSCNNDHDHLAPLEQLGLRPQCGFASTEEGNILTPNQQRAKLESVIEVADEIWGSA
jgi:5-methyltetrahydropteroyltriglutamate--homocysteine methyltransferase